MVRLFDLPELAQRLVRRVLQVVAREPAENRFGIGYTLNYGNHSVVLIVVSFLTLLVGLVAIAFVQPIF